MIFMSWNCHGVASKEFQRVPRNFVQVHQPNLVALLEPRISGGQANKACVQTGFDNWVRIEAIGFSAGICVLWKDGIHVTVLATHPQFLLLRVSDGISDPWCLYVVYGSPDFGLHKQLWEDLDQASLGFDFAWISIGYFNSVLSSDEVISPNNWLSHRSSGFKDWIFGQSLIDMGFHGSKFTWTRGLHSSSFKGARLDRALCNFEWKLLFPEANVVHLPKVKSDHSLLLIDYMDSRGRQSPRQFRFQAAWLSHPGFKKVIVSTWNQNSSLSDNNLLMASVLDRWNKDVFGNIYKRKRRLLARIDGVQRAMADKFTHRLIQLDIKLRSELDEVLA